MMSLRRKTGIAPEAGLQVVDLTVGQLGGDGLDSNGLDSKDLVGRLKADRIHYSDYLKFVFFSSLLLIPVYAIVKSAIRHEWLMMIIDALFVPVGFVHGVLMLAGVVN